MTKAMTAEDPQRELYRLWFEFLKRSSDAGHLIDQDYYRKWLPIEGLTFNQWWAGFRRQATLPSVELCSPGDVQPAGSLLLSVPQGVNKVAALKQIKAILDSQLSGAVRHGYAEFTPTTGSNIKYAAFRLMLHCYDSELKTDSKGRKASRVTRVTRVIQRYEAIEAKYGSTKRRIDKTPKAIDVDKGIGVGAEDILRNYYRSVSKAKRIIANVAQGQFPGKYT